MFGSSHAQHSRGRSLRFMLLWGLLWMALGIWLARNVEVVVEFATK